MRSAILLGLLTITAALLLAGCGGLESLAETSVNLPVYVPPMRVTTASSMAGAFARREIDASASSQWMSYLGTIHGCDSMKLEGSFVNRTDNVDAPSAAHVQLYVSNTEYTADNFSPTRSGVQSLISADLPQGEKTVAYASDYVPVSYEAGQIIQDGKFWLYAVGTPSTVDVDCNSAEITLKLRVGLL